MSENIQSISQGTYTIGASSTNDSSLLVAQNEGDVSILQTPQEVSHDASLSGTGTVDSPLGVVPGYNETVLYYNPTNHNVSNDAEFVMSESIWNFEKVMITFDNMEFTNRYVTMIIDLTGLPHDNNNLSTPWSNGNAEGELNIPWAMFQINASGNIKYINRGLIYGPWVKPSYTTGDSRGLRVVRAVGINRIANS